ncbi:nuclear matrix protein [Moesziomyces antarcticus T-34]|uniref:Nuclear matrix protein n=1 Tax=Pseudozyma antarctica (strain T-34) TaxID=1151754 RepID=M9M8E0_PSEA3|nr:nuclear matrix protein [Moesziomyces antarcticus T-34]
MSSTELAAERLRQCISELSTSLLAALSELRSAQAQQVLVPFKQVRDRLGPLVDQENIKQAFGLVENLSAADKDGPEVRVRNLCLEISNNELRKLVLESTPDLTGNSTDEPKSQTSLEAAFDRLDAVLVLSLHDLIDPTLPLSLVEELLEGLPISTCSQLFAYTESRVKPLTVDLHPTRGKGLVLLRTCNELLRRLSKPSQHHTVFAGRVLSLLAAVFPLGERSGVNLRGDFNVENKTHIEENDSQAAEEASIDADRDERDEIFKVDYDFYELFWKMQRFFSNPPLLMGASESSRPSTRSATPALHTEAADSDNVQADDDPAPDGAKGPMAELRISTRKILKLFAAVNKREKELAGAAMAEEAKSGETKGNTASQANSTRSTPALNKRRADGRSYASATGFYVGQIIGKDDAPPPAKRLRPDVLFEYEIRDTSFRKHILVQYLVLFQYLLSFTPTAKESWKDWKNKTLQALFTLEDVDERWIRSTWREILILIRDIQPHGRLFLESVLEVLKREANWIRWKTESCPSIEKPPLSPEQISAFASARALLLRKPEPYPHKLGTAALSELWLDGLRPPVAGTRRVENELGEYISVPTDGLEELEFLPPIPSVEHYNKSIQREKMKLDLRKKQLGIDPTISEAQLSKEDREKLDKDERIQATTETMQSLAWRALRVASRDHLHLFGKPERPEHIEGLLEAIETERNPKPKSVAPVETQATEEGAVQAQGPQDAEKAAEQSAELAQAGTADGPADAGETRTNEEINPDSAAVGSSAESKEQAASHQDGAAQDDSIVPVTIPVVPASPAAPTPSADAKKTTETPDVEAATAPATTAEQDVEMAESTS